MKIVILFGSFLALLTAAPLKVAAAKYVVIVNRINPINQVSKQDLKKIYRLKEEIWPNGVAIRPVNLKPNSLARQKFSTEILRRDVARMKSYYLKRALSGKGHPPKIIATEAEVIQFV